MNLRLRSSWADCYKRKNKEKSQIWHPCTFCLHGLVEFLIRSDVFRRSWHKPGVTWKFPAVISPCMTLISSGIKLIHLTLQDHTGAFGKTLVSIFCIFLFWDQVVWRFAHIMSKWWLQRLKFLSRSAGHHKIFFSSSVRLTSGNCSTFAHLQPLVLSSAFTGSWRCCCRQSRLWMRTLR